MKVQPNLALVKYWGKRDGGVNIPATSSLGITLDGLYTTTKVTLNNSSSGGPRISIGGSIQETSRFQPFFDALEHLLAEKKLYTPKESKEIVSKLSVESINSFPTAAGLASSSSGLGALATGIDALLETGLSQSELSALARSGSGSAARTIYGGFVEFPEGAEYASQLHPADYWPELRIILLTVSGEKKKTSSRRGMNDTKLTSPYYSSWIEDSRTQ